VNFYNILICIKTTIGLITFIKRQ